MAPALVGAVLWVAWYKSSDYFRERGFQIPLSAVVSLAGDIILDTISPTNTAILYFAMFLCTIGASRPEPVPYDEPGPLTNDSSKAYPQHLPVRPPTFLI